MHHRCDALQGHLFQCLSYILRYMTITSIAISSHRRLYSQLYEVLQVTDPNNAQDRFDRHQWCISFLVSPMQSANNASACQRHQCLRAMHAHKIDRMASRWPHDRDEHLCWYTVSTYWRWYTCAVCIPECSLSRNSMLDTSGLRFTDYLRRRGVWRLIVLSRFPIIMVAFQVEYFWSGPWSISRVLFFLVGAVSSLWSEPESDEAVLEPISSICRHDVGPINYHSGFVLTPTWFRTP